MNIIRIFSMKYSSFVVFKPDFESARQRIEDAGGWWVRFGDDVLTYSANDRWSNLESEFSSSQRNARQPTGTIGKAEMYLVVQKGRTFQLEHPDVEVIFDKGRYLVVRLTKAKARKMNKREDVCFHIEPLSENMTVFDTPYTQRSSAAASGAPQAGVVASVQQAVFVSHIEHLVSYTTRLSASSDYAAAADWCRKILAGMGFEVSVESVSLPGGQTSENVIGRKPGTGQGLRGNLVVTAHLDSVNHAGGPSAPAPGADDNASGAAGLLTLAAACVTFRFEHDLTFVLFGGEEQGLHGSQQYVGALDQVARDNILGVLNMDMIGSVNSEPPSVLLEGHAISQSLIAALAQSAADFTTLSVQTSLNPFASDHVPFINAGIPAVLTIEGADSANEAIHTANDTLDRVSPEFALQILRMNAGFVASLAGVSVGMPPADYGGHAVHAPPVSVEAAHMKSDLAFHFNALFAQYARLGRDGLLSQQDYGNWQVSRAAYDDLSAGTVKVGCGCGCGGC
ncbi:Zn-dependent exopeptidase M28 [Rhodobacterales bacterium]|nr:Zn-dependent exopeptidase M28 [Rhodobacterales bacterium]